MNSNFTVGKVSFCVEKVEEILNIVVIDPFQCLRFEKRRAHAPIHGRQNKSGRAPLL